MKEEVIAAGRLRHRVQIQRRIEAPNEFGEPTFSWETIGETNAAIEPLNARELLAAQQVQADVSHKITLRYYKGLTPKMRLVYHDYELGTDRAFNLESVINAREVNRKMVVMAKEEV